jgi:hypothetical protein
LPNIFGVAAPLLETAQLNREPPSLVEQAQEAVRWLSRAIVDLDEDSPDAAAALRRALPDEQSGHCLGPGPLSLLSPDGREQAAAHSSPADPVLRSLS